MKNLVILLVCCLAMFPNPVNSQEVTIGKENHFIDVFQKDQKYSYTQAIYKQEWIHAGGTINKIAYSLGSSEGPVYQVAIYMGHTSKEAFEDGIFNEDWVPFENLIKVYEGTLTFPTTAGWFEINLQTPFSYNNTDNLVIAIDRNSSDPKQVFPNGSLIDYDQSFTGTSGPDDSDPVNPIHTGSPSMFSPNIKLSGNLTISPYLYVYMPEKTVSTTPGSQISFDIETNQPDFEVSSSQPWLSFTKDIVNKKITGTVLGSTDNLTDWEQTSTILITSPGTVNDTAYLDKLRFEPKILVPEGQYFTDYDNDGDLDIAGNSMDIVRNDGNDIFTAVYNPEFAMHSYASYRADYADYDNDGDLDFLYKADSINIFRNDNNGKYTKMQVFSDLQIDRSTSTATPWCDYDNDGDLDLLLTGFNRLNVPKIYLYQNEGNDLFINTNIDFKALHKGSLEWVDYNSDGYADLMLAGSDMNGSVTTNLFKNEGNGKFTLIPADFPQLFNGRFSWGDYDADGDQDLIIGGSRNFQGHDASTGEHKIFRNDGNDQFTEISANLQLFLSCISKWIDFDNDGDLDIVTFGYIENYYSKTLLIYYENRGNDQFTELFRTEYMERIVPISISLGNYDNDGDVDLLLLRNWVSYCTLYRNNYNNTNNKPLPPSIFGVKREGTKTILYWNSGSDAETPSKALQYNIRVGSSPGKSDIIHPHADLSTGFITMPDLINCRDTFRILEDMPLGTYYYSIQSIDNMLTGSEFSSEQTFTVKEPYSIIEPGILPLEYGSFAVGDYDNDGDYDFVRTGKVVWWAAAPYTKLFTNNGDSTFSDSGIDLIQVDGSAAWGDYDNDNDLDLLIRGTTELNNHKGVIYRNDGKGVFTDIGFNDILYAKAVWADFDNDGDLDIIKGNRIFKNFGNDSLGFFKDIIMDGHPVTLALTDYDKDNDLDILTLAANTELFRNETEGYIRTNDKFYNTFRDIQASGEIDWSDFNNDDYPDLIITGQDTLFTKRTLIYRNNGNGSFIQTDPDIRAVIQGSVLSGDYNGDGNSDIVIAGVSSEILLTVYENDGYEKFKDGYTYFPDNYGTAILAWIDYNNDGYLDIISNYNVLFSNNSNTVKLPPEAPKNLQTEILGFDVNFSWEKPSEDSHFSYNLRVGTTPGGTEVVSPMADVVTGKRLILDKGNARLNTGWTIKDLKAAQTYYWSVQSVDASYRGGAWAPEKSFTMQTVYPDFAADTACNGLPTSFTDMSVSPLGDITNWKWDFGDGSNSLIQNPKHTFLDPGEYSVTLAVKKDSLTFSRTKTILVKASPKAGFTSNSIAQNRTLVTFANTSDTGNIAVTKWLWDFGDGLSFTGRDPQPHGYSDNGLNKVSLVIESENGCSDTVSAVLNICNETLEKPAIISRGPNVWYLQCSIENAKLYRWYLNDKLISDAKGYFYLANQKMGTYKVEISDKGECYIPSDEIKIPTGITGIEDSDPFEGVKIYPNPTPGMFTIEMDNNIFGELVIDIYNQTGSKALNIKFEKTTEHFQTQIDLSGQSKGMYLINLTIDKFKTVKKVLVE